MSYETEAANFITLGAAIAEYLGPAFVQNSQLMPHVVTQVFSQSSNQIKFTKDGYLVAEDLAESTNYSYSASSELTETSITITGTKRALGTKLTVEAARFGGPRANMANLMKKAGEAHARWFDTKVKALFSGLSGGVTASSTLTKDNILDARYTVESTMLDAFSGSLVGYFGFKGINSLRKEITNVTATAFSNRELLGILGKPGNGRGYVGELFGVDLYQTSGLPTSGGDDIQPVFDPMHTFGAGVDGSNGFDFSISAPSAINGVSTELLTWLFFGVGEINDGAGVRVLSDS